MLCSNSAIVFGCTCIFILFLVSCVVCLSGGVSLHIYAHFTSVCDSAIGGYFLFYGVSSWSQSCD